MAASGLIIPTIVVGVLVIILFTRKLQNTSKDPITIPGHPLFGHLPGILRHGTTLPLLLAQQNNYPPIYAITMFGQRAYTISSPELASLVTRKQKHLDTETQFLITVFKNMLGVDKAAMKLLLESTKPAARKARTPFREEMRAVEHKLLASGEHVEKLYGGMMGEVSRMVGALGSKNKNKISLLRFLEQVMITAAGTGLYGRDNPFVEKPSLGRDYWIYDSQMSLFLLNLLPEYTVPEAYRARERLVNALSDYHVSGGQPDMSEIIRRRSEIARRYGCSNDYLGRSEVELLNGLLSNMVPTIFWMLVHIMLDPSLAQRVMNEVNDLIDTERPATASLNPAEIRTKCPVLVATYQEALRLYASSARAYQVMEDFELTDDILLRKGSLVTIPAENIHRNPRNWGADALKFHVDRWLKADKPANSSAWVPFGGGSSICPGRFFVFDMILSTVVVVLHGNELGFAERTAEAPGRKTKIMSGIRIPVEDVDIVVSKREGSGGSWVFERKSL
ncbi:cytochrome P450 [Aspergillus karnatakaensis]|uniref:cytochrome P450 n=1 Tax=Aspergillus karnatakaensis TaxID=1810916 RepID=UPI003CCCCFC0